MCNIYKMSPIIKDSDISGPHVTAISIKPLNDRTQGSVKTSEKPKFRNKAAKYNERRLSLGNSALNDLPNELRDESTTPQVQLDKNDKHLSQPTLKRTQSLRLKSKNQITLASKDKRFLDGGTKNENSSKYTIKNFTSRFMRFSKPNTNADESKSNLRRSQSMKLSANKSFLPTKTLTNDVHKSASSNHLYAGYQDESLPKSRSLNHVAAAFSGFVKHRGTSLVDGHANKSLYKECRFSGEFPSLSNISEYPTESNSKKSLLMTSHEAKYPVPSRTFAHKTMEVLKTKIMGKSYKSTTKNVTNNSSITNSEVKTNKSHSKRKKIECNESDGEVKPKKKADHRKSPERISLSRSKQPQDASKVKSEYRECEVSAAHHPKEDVHDNGTMNGNIILNTVEEKRISDNVNITNSKKSKNIICPPTTDKLEIISENVESKNTKHEICTQGNDLLYTLCFDEYQNVEPPSFGRVPSISDNLELALDNDQNDTLLEYPNPFEMNCSYTETCCSDTSMAISINESECKSQSPMNLSFYGENLNKNHNALDSPMNVVEYDDYGTWRAYEESYYGILSSGINFFDAVPENRNPASDDLSLTNLKNESKLKNVNQIWQLQRTFSDASAEGKKKYNDTKNHRHSCPVTDIIDQPSSCDIWKAAIHQQVKPAHDAIGNKRTYMGNQTDAMPDVVASNTPKKCDPGSKKPDIDSPKALKKQIIINMKMMPKGSQDKPGIKCPTVINSFDIINKSTPVNQPKSKLAKSKLLPTSIIDRKLHYTRINTHEKINAIADLPASHVSPKIRSSQNSAAVQRKIRSTDDPLKISRQNSVPVVRKQESDFKNRRKTSLQLQKGVDKAKLTPRGISPCLSDISTSSDHSHPPILVPPGSRAPRSALLRNGQHGGSSIPRGLAGSRINDKIRIEANPGTPRRSKIEIPTPDISKAPRVPPYRKHSDPIKSARPALANGQVPRGGSQVETQLLAEQLKQLESTLSGRSTELAAAKRDTNKAVLGVEALTVLVHYLTTEYDAFSTPNLRSEIDRICAQVTQLKLCLDESCATVHRLESDASERQKTHREEVELLKSQQLQEVSAHKEKHRQETAEFNQKHEQKLLQTKQESDADKVALASCHKEEVEKLEIDWHFQLDLQHQKHLQALEQVNVHHADKLNEVENSWEKKEREMQEMNYNLIKDQETLKLETKNLEQTLLSDKDHRLQAAKRVCSSLQKEADSLKTVVDMRNTELHKLRDQLIYKEKLEEELESAREKAKSLQAKTEDLQAQMEKKQEVERRLMADHSILEDALQRETSTNKRLSLDNEELQWKLRQREQLAMAVSLPTSTLDLVTRSNPSYSRQTDGVSKCGGSSPQLYPRSPRVSANSAQRKGKLSDQSRRWSHSVDQTQVSSLNPTNSDQRDVLLESPPPSPCVKGVIEKSNSVSFILDLNEGTDSFLEFAPSPILKRRRQITRSSSRVVGGVLEKSISNPYIYAKFKQRDGVSKSKLQRDADVLTEQGQDECPSKFLRMGYTSIPKSDHNGYIERTSPTGLAWTVPVCSKGYDPVPVRPKTLRLLQQEPYEDEYEELDASHEFVEVLEIGDSLGTPLSSLLSHTPATSASDSDISQCGSRGEITSEDSEDDDSSDDEEGTETQDSKDLPQEGAGEAMIPSYLFTLNDTSSSPSPLDTRTKEIAKLQLSSVPSSDSEDPLNGLHDAVNISWSEDVEELTSSSDMQEL